jgi:hypothetical protein
VRGAAVLTLVCLGGCGTSNDVAVDRNSASTNEIDATVSAGSLTPVDVVVQSNRFLEEASAYLVVENLAMAACMSDAGYSGVLEEATALRELGEVNLDWRSEEGWGLRPEPDSPLPSPAEAEAYELAAYGSSPRLIEVDPGIGGTGFVTMGGCRQEAVETAYGSVEAWDLLTNGTFRHYNSGPAEIPPAEWAQIETAWEGCMSGRGYAYAAQGEPKGEFLLRYETEQPTRALLDEEIDVAVDDGECLIEAHLVDIRRRLSSQYLDGLDSAGRAEVEAILEAHRMANDAASEQIEALESRRNDG